MTNNDILRRIRYTFDFNDSKMIELFGLAGQKVTRAQISDWLKADDEPEFKKLRDVELAIFLNGLIIEKRGKKEGPLPEPEKRLNNNAILKKLKIALNMKNDDILDILEQQELQLSPHELTALFRKEGHKNFRECKDQILRNFLMGIQDEYRPQEASIKPFQWK